MAAFLIDYENVRTNGLKGVEYLNSADLLDIFYSQCCNKIQAEHMEAIIASGCTFKTYKLLAQGKNALDFYIASRCGVLSQHGENVIAIVSNDKGFHAVFEYFAEYEKGVHIIRANSIENALAKMLMWDPYDRVKLIRDRLEMLDLEAENIKYDECVRIKNILKEEVEGTIYETLLPKIMEYAFESEKDNLKVMYTDSLHRFGLKSGAKIYQMVKRVI